MAHNKFTDFVLQFVKQQKQGDEKERGERKGGGGRREREGEREIFVYIFTAFPVVRIKI